MSTLFHTTSTISDGSMTFWYKDTEDTYAERDNRNVFIEKNGGDPENTVFLWCTHEDSVVIVDESDMQKSDDIFSPRAEACITQVKNLTLFLSTADCIPLILHDPQTETLALVHLGWKPIQLHLTKKVINTFVTNFKSDPKDIEVILGPHIHKESYAVWNPEQKYMSEWIPYLTVNPKSGLTLVDIQGFTVDELLSCDILKENITISPIDTFTSKDHFSHKRSKDTEEAYERMGTIARIS